MGENNYTYSLLPEGSRSAICSQYGTKDQRDNWGAINGYLSIDCGKKFDIATEHADIKAACDAHTYPQEVLDVLKISPATIQATKESHEHAKNLVGDLPDDDEEGQSQWIADYKDAYDAAYPDNYSNAFDVVSVDPCGLTQKQIENFVIKFTPEIY